MGWCGGHVLSRLDSLLLFALHSLPLLGFGTLSLLGLSCLSLLFLAGSGGGFLGLLLFASHALLDLAAALLHLLVELALGHLAALLELGVALLGNIALELLVGRYQAAETVLQGNCLLVFLLGILERLGLGLLVSGQVVLALLGVVVAEVLELFLSVGTLKVVKSLGGESQLLAHLVLLLFKSLKLDLTDTTSVEVVDVEAVDIDTLDTLLELFELTLHFLSLDLFLLLSNAACLTLALLISQTLDLGLLELLGTQSLLLSLLTLLGGQSVGGGLLHLLDNLRTSNRVEVFLFSTSLGTLESGKLGLLAVLVEGRVDILAGDEKGLGQTGELRADNFSRSALQALDDLRASSATRVESAGRREDVRVKSQDTSGVVDTDGQITLLATVHDEFLNSGGGHLELLRELGEVKDELKFDSLVNLRKLLEETSEDDLLEGQDVLLHLRVGGNLGKNRRDPLAD